jgi:hypothetical protein
MVVAGVRMMARDAIATLVSRLISYAAEEVFSLGLAGGQDAVETAEQTAQSQSARGAEPEVVG